MKPHNRYWLCLLAGVLLPGCQKETSTVPDAERLGKVWIASSVRQDDQLVYTRGGARNLFNYQNFRLDLSAPPKAILADLTDTFSGEFEVLKDGQTRLLRLKNLVPEPTLTNGMIDYRIDELNGNTIKLTRTTRNAKTGAGKSEYELVVE